MSVDRKEVAEKYGQPLASALMEAAVKFWTENDRDQQSGLNRLEVTALTCAALEVCSLKVREGLARVQAGENSDSR